MSSIDEAIEKHRKIVETQKLLHEACILKDSNKHILREAEEHEQLAEWLEELKSIKEMDLSIPQHFTKEQSDWIKAYCIKRNIEFYNKAIDDFAEKIKSNDRLGYVGCLDKIIDETAEQLKAGSDNGT